LALTDAVFFHSIDLLDGVGEIAPMPYGTYADGLYLVKQRAQVSKSGVEHYGILDIGNRLKRSQGPALDLQPVVYHNTPPNLRADWLAPSS
jgi:hypothetical protein